MLTDKLDRSKLICDIHEVGTFACRSGTVVVMSPTSYRGAMDRFDLPKGHYHVMLCGSKTKLVNLSQAQGEERMKSGSGFNQLNGPKMASFAFPTVAVAEVAAKHRESIVTLATDRRMRFTVLFIRLMSHYLAFRSLIRVLQQPRRLWSLVSRIYHKCTHTTLWLNVNTAHGQYLHTVTFSLAMQHPPFSSLA